FLFTFPPLVYLVGELLQRIDRRRGRRRRFDEWLVVLVARLEVLGIFFERVGDRFGTFDRTRGPPRAFLHARAPAAALPREVCIERLPREAAVPALGPAGAQLAAFVQLADGVYRYAQVAGGLTAREPFLLSAPSPGLALGRHTSRSPLEDEAARGRAAENPKVPSVPSTAAAPFQTPRSRIPHRARQATV